MAEPVEPEADPPDSLVDGSFVPSLKRGLMPRHDLVPPAHDGAPERAHFGRDGLVLETDAELACELHVSDPVDRTDGLPGVPAPLHEMRFGVIELRVYETVAGRAVPAGLDRGAALGVPGGVRRVGVPGSPLRQQAQCPSEIPALGR